MTMVLVSVLYFVLILFGYGAVYCYNNKRKPSELSGAFKLTKGRVIYLVVSLLAAIYMVVIFSAVYNRDWLFQVKLAFLIGMILPCAATDYRLHKIPNFIILMSIILRFILFGMEFFFSSADCLETLKDSMIGALVIGGFFFLMLLIFKNSIGMGDVKLFFVVGLYQGLWGGINSVFFSLLVSFVVSIALLIARKKHRKDVIPFAPSILLGTLIAIGLAGM